MLVTSCRMLQLHSPKILNAKAANWYLINRGILSDYAQGRASWREKSDHPMSVPHRCKTRSAADVIERNQWNEEEIKRKGVAAHEAWNGPRWARQKFRSFSSVRKNARIIERILEFLNRRLGRCESDGQRSSLDWMDQRKNFDVTSMPSLKRKAY